MHGLFYWSGVVLWALMGLGLTCAVCACFWSISLALIRSYSLTLFTMWLFQEMFGLPAPVWMCVKQFFIMWFRFAWYGNHERYSGSKKFTGVYWNDWNDWSLGKAVVPPAPEGE